MSVSAGDAVEFVGVGEDYISWQGGRTAEGLVRIGLSYTNVGAAVKPGERAMRGGGNGRWRVGWVGLGRYAPSKGQRAQQRGFLGGGVYRCSVCGRRGALNVC